MAQLQNLTTPDGRQLEYFSAGDPDGRPLLFHVGTPNAGHDFAVIVEPATQLGLRVIGYSRPGYGGSSERQGRSVADGVDDVRAVLDAVGVDRFLTLGWSGGGPHALACAALLPQRCQAAVSLAGVAPHDAHGIDFLTGMDQDNVDEFTAAAQGVAELTAYLEPLAEQFRHITGDSVVEGMSGLLSAVDKQALTGAFAADMAEALRRAVSSGIAGWRDDDLAFVKDWGFELADISVPVAVWQGRQDRMVPFEHGQWLAAEIPTAQPHLFAGEGHLSLISQATSILSDLIEIAG